MTLPDRLDAAIAATRLDDSGESTVVLQTDFAESIARVLRAQEEEIKAWRYANSEEAVFVPYDQLSVMIRDARKATDAAAQAGRERS